MRRLGTRLARCRRGAVAPIFAAVACSVIAFAGIGVDYGAVLLVRSSFQSAVDAAVAASELRRELLDDELYDFARRQFEANLSPKRRHLVREFKFRRDADGVRAEVEASVATPFSALLGVTDIAVRAESSIEY